MLLNIHKFLELVSRADRYFRHQRPDAVVLIDYPGLQLVDRPAGEGPRHSGLLLRPPQIWAWAGWRVKKMRRFVDHVLCRLPFEEAWYRERGCQATYVGHPYFDELRRRTARRRIHRAAAIRHGRWWRSCPARARRKSRTTSAAF